MRLWRFFALTVLCVAAAYGQKPDFTGTWKQTGLRERETVVKIQHQEPELRMSTRTTFHFAPSTLDRPLPAGSTDNAEFRTGEKEKVSKSDNGRERWSSIFWEQSALVFLSVLKDGYHVTVTRTAWTLSEGGDMLTKSTRVVNLDGVKESTETFERQ